MLLLKYIYIGGFTLWKKKNKKKIEIVSGNGEDLDISPVYDNLEIEKPKQDKPKNIVIPKK